MRLLLTSSTPFCQYFQIWLYFFCLLITRAATSTSNSKGFL